MRQTACAYKAETSHDVIAKDEAFQLSPGVVQQSVSMVLPQSAFSGVTQVHLGDQIVVEGALSCGLSTRVALHIRDFRGVAARLTLSDEMKVVCEIVLLHRDPSLNLPFARSDDMETLAPDWQAWGRRFNLPLILIEPDGAEQMVSHQLGGLDVDHPQPRRHRSMLSQRRPRFLVRRKTGFDQSPRHIETREMIART